MSQRTAFWITHILSDDGRGRSSSDGEFSEFPFPVAAKTGTSEVYGTGETGTLATRGGDGVASRWVTSTVPHEKSSDVTGTGPIFHEACSPREHRALGRVPARWTRPSYYPAGIGTSSNLRALRTGKKRPNVLPAPRPLPVDEVPPMCRSACAGGRARAGPSWPPEYRSWAAGREASAVSAPSPGHAPVGRSSPSRTRPREAATGSIPP